MTIGLAWASWQFIESPILREGFLATCRQWWSKVTERVRLGDPLLRVAPLAVSAVAVAAGAQAADGIARPPEAPAPPGQLPQVAEGRSAAAAVDAYLMGTTALPAPIPPTARPLT